MSSRVNEIIYVGCDNVFIVGYSSDDSYDFSEVTKVEFELNGKAINSADDPDFFDYSGGTVGELSITLKLGLAGYTPADSGGARVTIFDAVNIKGLVFSDPLSDVQLNVKVIL